MSEIEKLERRVRELEAALKPFADFGDAYSRKPMGGMDDEFYSIHAGTDFEAGIRFSDCVRASQVLRVD
jgi:hypothetical protein